MSESKIHSFYLQGPAGRLEALLNAGLPSAGYAAVVAHPHPLYGGTMHTKAVFHAMKALNSFGFPVLRFNFRGVGHSAGTHDNGAGEMDDVRAALDWLEREYHLPLIFAGFSFGAAIGLRAACPDPRVAALISLGTPIGAEGRSYSYPMLAGCAKPKLLLSGGNDEYASPEQLAAVAAAAASPKRFVLIPGADHYFAGHLDEMRAAIQVWVADVLQPAAGPTV
ncbi:MAG TPA: alpha/beta fold hydrolase [Clostridia bacterium]|nr:alpha/beta fold hydrolase [Clostridia bacterium]